MFQILLACFIDILISVSVTHTGFKYFSIKIDKISKTRVNDC